VIKRQM